MTLQIGDAGTLTSGETVQRATLVNAHGLSVGILSFGGIVEHLLAPDRDGRLANIVLGYADLAGYEAHNGNTHFGALIGRYANRIAHGRFTLDGTEHRLPVNDGPNSLHGGPDGFGRRLWSMAGLGEDAVRLTLGSPDGEAGYPGNLDIEVVYRLTDDNELIIEYGASCDAATVLNLTNHSYFNLAGEASGSIEDHVVQIEADHFTPVDASLIPTGQARAQVDGHAAGFSHPDRGSATACAIAPRADGARSRLRPQLGTARPGRAYPAPRAATVHDPGLWPGVDLLSPRSPACSSTAATFSTARSTGTSGHALPAGRTGCAWRLSTFPDSPNQPDFPSTVLRPGGTYRERTVFSLHVI